MIAQAERPVIEVRQLASGEWQLYRSIRLAALADAPYAFGSTYERESAFPEEKWQQRATEGATGKESICIVALDGENGVGIAGGITYQANTRINQLISMWVHEDHRGTDIAARLVSQIEVWAFDRGSERIILGVTDGNDRAARFYKKLGFETYDEPVIDEDCLTVLHKPLSIN